MFLNLITINLIFSIFNICTLIQCTEENKNIKEINQDDQATRGAIFESVFILKNRKNYLSELKQNIKEDLEESDLIIQELVNEKQLLSTELFQKQTKNKPACNNIISRLNGFCHEFHKYSIIKNIYPEYVKELEVFIENIGKDVDKISQTWTTKSNQLELSVKKANLMIKIINKKNTILDNIFNLQDQELAAEKYKNRLNNLHKKIQTENNEEQKKIITRLINKYKNIITKKQNKLNLKKNHINLLKNQLSTLNNKLYTNHLKIKENMFFIDKIDKIFNSDIE